MNSRVAAVFVDLGVKFIYTYIITNNLYNYPFLLMLVVVVYNFFLYTSQNDMTWLTTNLENETVTHTCTFTTGHDISAKRTHQTETVIEFQFQRTINTILFSSLSTQKKKRCTAKLNATPERKE